MLTLGYQVRKPMSIIKIRNHLLELASSFLVFPWLLFSTSQRSHVNCLPCVQRRGCKSTGMVDIRSVSGRRPVALELIFSPQAGVSHYSVSLLSRVLSSPNSATMNTLSTWDSFASARPWALGYFEIHSANIFQSLCSSFFAFEFFTGVFLVCLTKFLKSPIDATHFILLLSECVVHIMFSKNINEIETDTEFIWGRRQETGK